MNMSYETLLVVPMAEEPTEETRALLAARFKARREELGLTQHDLQSRGGPSAGPIARLEGRHHEWPKTSAVRTKWALALGWGPDAWERILLGEEPRERPVTASSGIAPGADRAELEEMLDHLQRDLDTLRRRLGGR